MFTGIIEEVGTLKGIRHGENLPSSRSPEKSAGRHKIGDSISTNGVCLTVTKLHKGCLRCGRHAGNAAALKPWRPADGRPRQSGTGTAARHPPGRAHRQRPHRRDRIDQEYRKDDNAVWITISAGPELLRYIIEKGSIAIDGVSLTVATVDSQSFRYPSIPHTGAETILLEKKLGDTVNLECDIIGKYVEKLLGLSPKNTNKTKQPI